MPILWFSVDLKIIAEGISSKSFFNKAMPSLLKNMQKSGIINSKSAIIEEWAHILCQS